MSLKKSLMRHEKNDSLTIPSSVPKDFIARPSGLSSEQAESLQHNGKGNRTKDASRKPLYLILATNFFTLFNLLNFALAFCLILVGSYRNMLFLGVVFSNTIIGTVQEIRAQRTIRKLQLMNPSLIQVLRDGKTTEIVPEELVEGDVVILSRGSQVPADAIVLSGSGAVDESMLTGESLPIQKAEGAWVLSGTFVTEGQITVQLVRVGENSYVSRLTREARKIRPPKSALMGDLGKLTKYLSFILVPLGMLLFCKQYFWLKRPLETAVPQAVAAMVGMIPEGLILLTSVALCVGVVRLGKKGALVQELYGIETLSRADILCLDKTGTLTTGGMSLYKLHPLSASEDEMKSVLSHILAAFPDDTTSTFQAIRDQLSASTRVPDRTIPFSSSRKCSCAFFGQDAYLFGAPSFVMRTAMTDELQRICSDYAQKGYRVLLLAKGQTVEADDLPDVQQVLGLVILQDHVREEAPETLRYFREQGVTIKIISGDDPRTVSAVARSAGLEGADAYIDTSTLTEEEIQTAALRYTVFGRVTPEQKRILVLAMQSAGHHVAMTGDGVNDIPALKAADCSIAMASGAQAAKNSAQLTLLSSDFSLLPDVVLEGRRVVNNVTRSATLFLVKTLYSFFLSLLLLFLPATYPFQPVQLTVVSSFTIGIPAFLLSLEANKERIRGKFIRNVLLNALPGAICVTLCACFSMIMENFGWSNALGSTMATLSAGGIGLLELIYISRPFNRYRFGVLCLMTLALILTFFFFGRLLYFTMPDPGHLLVLALMLLFSCVFMHFLGSRVHAAQEAQP